MKRVWLFVILVLFVSVSAYSQRTQTIKGKLADLVDNKPLSGATLKLTSIADPLSQYSTLADSTGVFNFSGLPVDSFYLDVSYIGYENFRQIVSTVDSVPVINLGTLFVPKTSLQLADVTVTSRTPPAQQKGDTTQYNASQFKVNPDANVEDLIKKMPGITVDRDGKVTAQGEQVRKVTIDGRDFFGDDATAALRNLPSEIVDKIQVFDRLSDQAQFTGFDDGNSERTINVVTKTGMRDGQFGRIYAGYGTDERYSAGGNVSFFNGNRRVSLVGLFNNINQQNFGSQDLLGLTSSGGGRRGGGGRGGGGFRGFGGGAGNFMVGQQSGISRTNAFGINFTDAWGKKLEVSGSYFFNNSRNTNNENSLEQNTANPDSIRFYEENSISLGNNYNHRLNLRVEYKIDSANTLIFTPNLSIQQNNSENNYFARTYINDISNLLNESVNNTSSDRQGYNFRNNILYRHAFKKRGRTFSINLNTSFNNNDGESYVLSQNTFYKIGLPPEDSIQNQFMDNISKGRTISTNVAYTEPIGKRGQLQFSYNPSFTKNEADQQTFQYDAVGEKYSVFDPRLSNKFENDVTTHNGGLSYRINIDRDNGFSVGANVQHTNLLSERVFPEPSNVDKSFFNVLPNLMWRKKFSPKSSIRVFYRASTNVPSVTQLQDVVNNSNLLSLSSGNPDLKQQYSHFISGRYTFTNTLKGQSFFANIFLQTAEDYISNAVYIASADSLIQQNNVLKRGAQLSKPVNLDGYKSLRSFFTYSMPLKFIKTNLNLSAGFTYSRLPGMWNYDINHTNNYTYNAGIVLASNVSEYVDFNLSYSANFSSAKNAERESADNKYTTQSAGIQFNLLSKSGWFLQNDLSNQSYNGLSAGFNQSFWLWNAAIGKKFLKNNAGELKLSVFDLLKQNQSISRIIEPNLIRDVQNQVLQQYFMLTFTYNLKNFGKPAAAPRRGSGEFRSR